MQCFKLLVLVRSEVHKTFAVSLHAGRMGWGVWECSVMLKVLTCTPRPPSGLTGCSSRCAVSLASAGSVLYPAWHKRDMDSIVNRGIQRCGHDKPKPE
jgi:hypothetical protein